MFELTEVLLVIVDVDLLELAELIAPFRLTTPTPPF